MGRELYIVKLRDYEGCCEKFIMAKSPKEAIELAIKTFSGNVSNIETKLLCSEHQIINLKKV